MLKITHLFTISAVPNIFFRSEKEQKVFFRHMVHHPSTAVLTSGYFTPNSISELLAIMCKKNRRLTQAGKPLSSKRLLKFLFGIFDQMLCCPCVEALVGYLGLDHRLGHLPPIINRYILKHQRVTPLRVQETKKMTLI